ncbi:hypothetical protein U1Q18_024420 [Sarracenia purpurea var. burkii]
MEGLFPLMSTSFPVLSEMTYGRMAAARPSMREIMEVERPTARGFWICAKKKHSAPSGRNQSCGCRCLTRIFVLLARTIALLGTKDLHRLSSGSPESAAQIICTH